MRAMLASERTRSRLCCGIETTLFPGDCRASSAVGLEELQGFDHVVETHLDEAVVQLSHEFEGIHDEAHVRAMLGECADHLSRGRVAAFVPTLDHRYARERLRAEARSEGRISRDVTEVLFVSLTGGGRAQMA